MLNRAILSAVLLIAASFFSAQTLARSEFAGELQAAHERLLKDPANLDLLYEYARIAIRQGNFESGVAALEGMLVISRNQPRVLLELGVLYQRLGATRVAQSYLRRAKELAEGDSEMVAYVNEYLAEADKVTERSALWGFVKLGVRYQSNPRMSPEASEILSGGTPIPLPEELEPNSDLNAMLFSRVNHRYRVNKSTAIASDVVAYGALYDEQDQLNYGLLEATSGVRLESTDNSLGRYSFRPHLLLRGSRLDGAQFESTLGAGLDFEYFPGLSSQLRARYQYRDVDFKDINGLGVSNLRSGDEQRLDFRFSNEFIQGHTLELGLFGRSRNTEREYFDVDQYDITLRYSVRFRNVLFHGKPRITLTPYIIRRFSDYGGPDPVIDPSQTREDREWRVGLDFSVPIAQSWSVFANLERSDVESNIVNYEADNNLFTVGLRKGF